MIGGVLSTRVAAEAELAASPAVRVVVGAAAATSSPQITITKLAAAHSARGVSVIARKYVSVHGTDLSHADSAQRRRQAATPHRRH